MGIHQRDTQRLGRNTEAKDTDGSAPMDTGQQEGDAVRV